MKRKLLLALLVLIISGNVFSQNEKEISELLLKKEKFQLEIYILQDSIDNIGLRIQEIKSLKFVKKINDSTFTAEVRKGAKIHNKPFVFSDVILKFDSAKEVNVINYNSGFFEICYNSLCGYINEVWFNQTKELKEFMSLENLNKESTQNEFKSFSPVSNKTSLSKQVEASDKSKIKTITTRVYYRGPRGGCYYINSNGNKTYVSRSLCD